MNNTENFLLLKLNKIIFVFSSARAYNNFEYEVKQINNNNKNNIDKDNNTNKDNSTGKNNSVNKDKVEKVDGNDKNKVDKFFSISFNNQIVDVEQVDNSEKIRIKDINTICQSIEYVDQNNSIIVRYIPQEDNSLIKYTTDCNFLDGTTKYKACIIEKDKVYETLIKDLDSISSVIDVEGDNAKIEHFKNKVLDDVILKNYSDKTFEFKISNNGKVNSISAKDCEFMDRLKKLENLSRSDENWEVGHFGVAVMDVYLSLVANGFDTDNNENI